MKRRIRFASIAIYIKIYNKNGKTVYCDFSNLVQLIPFDSKRFSMTCVAEKPRNLISSFLQNPSNTTNVVWVWRDYVDGGKCTSRNWFPRLHSKSNTLALHDKHCPYNKHVHIYFVQPKLNPYPAGPTSFLHTCTSSRWFGHDRLGGEKWTYAKNCLKLGGVNTETTPKSLCLWCFSASHVVWWASNRSVKRIMCLWKGFGSFVANIQFISPTSYRRNSCVGLVNVPGVCDKCKIENSMTKTDFTRPVFNVLGVSHTRALRERIKCDNRQHSRAEKKIIFIRFIDEINSLCFRTCLHCRRAYTQTTIKTYFIPCARNGLECVANRSRN